MDYDLKSVFDEFNNELRLTTKVFSRTKLRNSPKPRRRRSPFTSLGYASSRSLKLSTSPSPPDFSSVGTLTPPKSPDFTSSRAEVSPNKRRKTGANASDSDETAIFNNHGAAIIKRRGIVSQMQNFPEIYHDEDDRQVLIWSSSEEESEPDSDLDLA